jgi:signal transduction histidine kinase
MLRAWGLDDPETARVGAEAIHRESRHMRKLVEDLLALARGDERAPLKLGLHDLDALAAADGRPSVRHVPADEPVQARSDRERVEQAVAILLDNAVKYTAEWGKITVSTTRRDSGVMLEVSDTGKGVPEEDLPYVFERFYRADETRAARGSASR